jgi:ATP synthase protein I
MKPKPSDKRSPIAQAIGVAYEIIGASMTFVLPTVGGWWLDQRLGTGPIWLLVGVVLGLVIGTWSLVKLIQGLNKKNND